MLNNEFPPLGGGTGTVNLELFKFFKNNPNLKIDLITSSFSKTTETESFSDKIKIFKLPVGKKNIHHASNLELIKYAIKATIKSFNLNKQKKYDFVFVWSTVPAGLPAFLLKLLKKTPYIIRVGGPDIPGFEKRYTLIYKIISPFIKLIWKKSDFIIAKCKTEKEMINAINHKLKVKTIFNGVNTETFKPKENKQIKNENLVIICSARLIKRKGQDTLINAIAKLKKENILFTVNLIGEGDEKDEYIKLAKEQGIFEQIKFLEYIPRKEMPKKYKIADVFVLPSYNEGMSNALLEAMACGLPVIVTKVGGTEELVDSSNGYVFNAGDTVALVKILKNIAQNKKQLRILGKNSRKKAEKLNWQNIANEYTDLFNKIVE